MTTELFDGPDLFVTRYAGPLAAHPDRRRWQVTLPGEYVQVDIDQLPALIDQLEASAAILKAERDA